MQGKPTPGPWVANNLHTGDTPWRVESDAEGYPNDGWNVAVLHGPDAKANAHFIASAPDMLARLATYEAALREIEAETQRDTLNPRSVLQSVGIIAREALEAK